MMTNEQLAVLLESWYHRFYDALDALDDELPQDWERNEVLTYVGSEGPIPRLTPSNYQMKPIGHLIILGSLYSLLDGMWESIGTLGGKHNDR